MRCPRLDLMATLTLLRDACHATAVSQEWLDEATATSVATAVGAVLGTGFDKEDTAQQAATLVACYAMQSQPVSSSPATCSYARCLVRGLTRTSCPCVPFADVVSCEQYFRGRRTPGVPRMSRAFPFSWAKT